MADDRQAATSYPNDEPDRLDTPKHRARREAIKGVVGTVIVAVIGYISWTRFFFPPGSIMPSNFGSSAHGARKYDVGSVSQFASANQPVEVTADNQVAFVDFSAGYPHCLSAICPHQGCRVAWQAAQNQYVCPCHDSTFARDGSLVHGPATKPLKTLPSSVDNGSLYVQV